MGWVANVRRRLLQGWTGRTAEEIDSWFPEAGRAAEESLRRAQTAAVGQQRRAARRARLGRRSEAEAEQASILPPEPVDIEMLQPPGTQGPEMDQAPRQEQQPVPAGGGEDETVRLLERIATSMEQQAESLGSLKDMVESMATVIVELPETLEQLEQALSEAGTYGA